MSVISGWIEQFRGASVGRNDKIGLFAMGFVLGFARAKIWINGFYELTRLVIVVQFDLERAFRNMADRTVRKLK